MRVLAIQLNQPGDAILTTPTLRWLVRQGHEVHAMVQPLSAELLRTMDGLAGVHPLPRGSFQISRDIRRWNLFRAVDFDWALVFSRCSERPALWAWLSRAPLRSALLNENFPTLLRPLRMINEWRRYPAWSVHVVEQHLALAGADEADKEFARLEYTPAAEAVGWHAEWLREHGLTSHGYLHFHLTARWPSKCWPVEHVRTFLQRAQKELACPIVVSTGPAEFEKQYAAQSLDGLPLAVTEIGTLAPHQLGAIIAGAGAFLGMDSMPMHLAAALQIPGLALFGSTNADQWGPWRAKIEVIRTPDAAQRMAAIAPELVVERLRSLDALCVK